MSAHLKVVQIPEQAAKPSTVPRWRRWLVIGLVALAGAMIIGAYFLPWWSLTLYAPQYPRGLRVSIALTGVSGDVAEINELNHYIGMAKLESAATVERQFAVYGLAGVVVAVLGLALLLGKKTNKLLVVPVALFPVGFILDNLYWLHAFGNNLDKRAALRIPPFTPEFFGNGEIGQFRTFATPGTGFWLVLVAVVVVVIANVVRGKVCKDCSRAGTCGAVCSSVFLGKEKSA